MVLLSSPSLFIVVVLVAVVLVTVAKMAIYYLNNGEEGWEADRLDWNHSQMVMPLVRGAILPRDITEDLQSKSSPRIADVCTGTGIWAISAAEALPNAQVYGFDIDVSKFAMNAPPNVQLQYGNVFEPFPCELLGTFDVIHARFLVSLLKKEDWVPVAQNFMTLLRPGGWILWEDSGPFEFRVLPITPGWMKYAKLSWSFCNANGMDLRYESCFPPTRPTSSVILTLLVVGCRQRSRCTWTTPGSTT